MIAPRELPPTLPPVKVEFIQEGRTRYICPKCGVWLDNLDWETSTMGECQNCNQGFTCISGYWVNLDTRDPYYKRVHPAERPNINSTP